MDYKNELYHIVKEYLVKNYKISDPTIEFIETKNLNEETVKLLICDRGLFWKSFFKWLFIYKFVNSKKSGDLLKSEGWKQGKEIGDELKRLRYLEIDKLKSH